MARPMRGAGVGHVLDPGDGRLRTQLAVRRRQVERHLEYRIDAKTVGVVAVLVAGGDHQEAEADDVGESVRDLIRCALILDTASKSAAVARPRAASGRHYNGEGFLECVSSRSAGQHPAKACNQSWPV